MDEFQESNAIQPYLLLQPQQTLDSCIVADFRVVAGGNSGEGEERGTGCG